MQSLLRHILYTPSITVPNLRFQLSRLYQNLKLCDAPHYHCPSIISPCYCRIKSQDSTMHRSCNDCSGIYYIHLSLLYQISNSLYHYRTKILNSTMPHIITAPAYIPLLLSHKSQDSTVSHSITAPGICPFITVVRKP